MILKKLIISNYRSLEHFEIDFDKDLTVVLGINGVGKTTILEAASVAIGTVFSSINEVSSVGIKKTDARRVIRTQGSREVSAPQYPVSIEAEGEVDGQIISWKRTLESPTGRTTVQNASAMTDIGKKYVKQLQNGDDSLVLPFIGYYGIGRLWDNKGNVDENVKINTRLNGYDGCMNGSPNAKSMMNWFQKMSYLQYQRANNGDGDTPELEVVYTAMKMCIEDASRLNDVKIWFNPDIKELEVRYSEQGNTIRVPLSLMSAGYKATVNLVADIAYRITELNPQLGRDALIKTDGIALIDEIDLHLHPSWQQIILSSLKKIFPKIQFIVTTHAPAVVNMVRDQSVRIIDEGLSKLPSVQTYGRDTNQIMEYVLNASSRPEFVSRKIKEFDICLDEKKYKKAQKIIDAIVDEIGEDPKTTDMRIQLSVEQIEENDD